MPQIVVVAAAVALSALAVAYVLGRRGGAASLGRGRDPPALSR